MKPIYVILVTYNPMQWIGHCMEALSHSTVPVVTVIVDNCSTDGARDYIPLHYPNAVWLPQEYNRGFGQGNNVGFRYALSQEAEYVLLLNQDAYLAPDALEQMLKVADGRSLVTPVHLNGDGSRIDYMFRNSLRRADIQLFDDLLLHGIPADSYEIGEVCAACWLMPVSMLQEIGGFNPLFFQYGEDNNYYTRLRYHKRKVLLASKARMCHDRKIHGQQALYSSREMRLRVLTIACDPSLSVYRRCCKWLMTWFVSPLSVSAALLWLTLRCGRINDSRRREKMIGKTWL